MFFHVNRTRVCFTMSDHTHIIISNLKSSRSGCIIVILPSSREDDVLDVNSHTVVSEAIHWNGN